MWDTVSFVPGPDERSDIRVSFPHTADVHAGYSLRRRSIMSQSDTAKASGFFRPRRLGHANLFVSDYERASEFYQSVVGFEEVYRQPDNRASFLSNGNT